MPETVEVPAQPDRPKTPNAKPRFPAQRRRLLSISVVLGVYLLAGVSLRTASVFGNQFEIGKPVVVPIALWLFWFYWLVRYLQFRRDLGNEEWQERYEQEMRLILPRALAKRYIHTPEWRKEHAECRTRVFAALVTCENHEPLYWTVSFWLQANCTIGKKWHNTSRPLENQNVNCRHVRLERIRARLRVYARTPYFTEYVLPVVVALLPLAFVLVPLVVTALRHVIPF